ncbi:MAG: hypothetical protein PHX58_05880 [Desulfovibrio sp.]|nr:hypothetical protein [Desulfovibrio sp.]
MPRHVTHAHPGRKTPLPSVPGILPRQGRDGRRPCRSLRLVPPACTLWLFPLVLALLLATPGRARPQSPAQWKQREQQCIAACPKPNLRYQAGESAARQRQRLAQEDRYNACFLRCTRDYVRHYPNLGKGQGGDSVIYYRNR